MIATVILDIGLVVGFSVVSIPFLNLANPRYVNSTYSDRLQVKLLIINSNNSPLE